MRSLWFMPFTFIAGQRGFALFAPYLAAFLATAHLTRARRKRANLTIARSPSIDSPMSPTLALAT